MVQPGRTPLHIQLADIIRSQIESGVFNAGDQLPTEMELMKQHELSSSTVRQAVLALVGEGLLYRRAGKGTFVAKRHIGRDLLTFSGFSEEAVARGFRPGTRHVTVAWRSADAVVAAALNVPTDERVLTIERLRTIDDEVVAVETVSFAAAIGRQMEKLDLADTSFTEIIERQLGVALARARQEIRAGAARARLAKALEVSSGTAVLQIDRTAFDTSDRVIYFSSSSYRADRYIYTGWIERKSASIAHPRQLIARSR
ncbi:MULTISPECIES: GntR family transcriptional regulator [unclassified Mesorhizobium]|uniref:GntR family transcriptional regulator n=1 Tax=unclassified Mesorhizobium TaxID=325217 RepID=UPI0019289809|nr:MULTISPECIES: GntR family transcriptional regulator [unclassified Mesorhizobium]BCG97467.1 UbiC transcription regulator-associated domain protein [Mesorhizobium sp. 131-2-1]BCH04535.1 UbiC transcription regulator-associated domain protein [Mesorhizobium sp. 131-2-5]